MYTTLKSLLILAILMFSDIVINYMNNFFFFEMWYVPIYTFDLDILRVAFQTGIKTKTLC